MLTFLPLWDHLSEELPNALEEYSDEPDKREHIVVNTESRRVSLDYLFLFFHLREVLFSLQLHLSEFTNCSI